MKKELEHKLLEAAPLLYSDRYQDPRETCMYWGFECSDGWFDLLMEASIKLEAVIRKIADEQKSTACYKCGCDVLDHKPGINDNMPCNKIHYLPYHFGGWRGGIYTWCWSNMKPHVTSIRGWKWIWRFMIWRRIQNKWYQKVNRIAQWLYDKFNIGYNKPCHCKGFQSIYPRAAQVKEKFGTLRFYMTMGNDEIYDIIREAEKKSAITCECCGKPGELRDNGWLFTLCNKCNEVRKKTGRAPWLDDA